VFDWVKHSVEFCSRSTSCSLTQHDTIPFILSYNPLPIKQDEVVPSIFFCSEKGDLNGMRQHLLILRTNPNSARASDGTTPLILASGNNHAEIVKLLLDCGADKEQRNFANDRALNLSIRNRHNDITQILSLYIPTMPEQLRPPVVKKERPKKINPLAVWRRKSREAIARRRRNPLPGIYKAHLNPADVVTPANSPTLTVSMEDYMQRAEGLVDAGVRTTRAVLPVFRGASRERGGVTVLVAEVEVPPPGKGGPAFQKPQLAQTQLVRRRWL